MRTTFTLPASLLQQLKLYAANEGIPMSSVVEQGIKQVITRREKHRLEVMYQGLETLKGIGSPNITDGSTTIDQVLYGSDAQKGRGG